MIDQPTVVIVGGGYGGVNAAKALDAYADVVLVEPKDAFALGSSCWRTRSNLR